MTTDTALRTDLSKVIHDTIEAMPHARRLYPDLYSDEIADAVIERLSTNA